MKSNQSIYGKGNYTPVSLSSTRESARQEYEGYLGKFLRESPVVKRRGEPGVADLLFGDPHDPALPSLEEILKEQITLSQTTGYRYVHNMPEAQEAASMALSVRTGLNYNSQDLFITSGAFSGLVLCLQSFCSVGSEVIYFSPPWFYYRSMIKSVGAVPVGIDMDSNDWSVPFKQLERAINSKTSAILVNSPHNPTGKVFSDEELSQLARIVTDANKKIGRTIPIISDESYSRIVYEHSHAPTPARHYPATATIYTYGKTLLAPSLRLGYIAIAPDFPNKLIIKRMIDALQPIGGWLYPACFIQRGIPQFEKICVDITRLKKRRDKLYNALMSGGYEVVPAQGTFYMMVKSPEPDDYEYSLYLEQQNILVLPGSTLETPGTFRVSLTASDSMIDQAAQIFESME